MIKYISLILILFFNHEINALEIIGIPKVVDGDTIYIDSYKIRLEGIDAPEMKQKCRRNEKEYFCGNISKKRLEKKIENTVVKCISLTKDRYKRYLATCFSKKINLNRWMVKNGYALAYRRYSKMYVNDERFAKENNLGLWSGTFIQPEKWRKLN